MTSLPVRSIQNLIILSSLSIMYLCSKFEGNRTIFAEITNMTLLVHFYIAQILPEPEVVRLFVYHIKTCLGFLFWRHLLSFQSDHWLQRYSCIGNFAYYAYISGTGSAIAKIRKTIFTIHKLYILCKFQLCSPYSGFWKLMLEEE